MRNGSRWIAVALGIVLAASPVAIAWGPAGHRIVAQIGQDDLSDDARESVLALTGGKRLALLATWPDFIRSDHAWDCVKPWHFLTVEDGESLDAGLERPADTTKQCLALYRDFRLPQNVVGAIDFFADVVRGDEGKTKAFGKFLKALKVKPVDGSIRLTGLIFLVHFVGDVHQPLHVGRGGDRGGNSVAVNWFDELSELHAVWDEGLIGSEGLSFTELASFVEEEYDGQAADFGAGPTTWAEESVEARQQVYEIWNTTDRANHLPDLSYDYAAQNIGLVKQRLYRGGMRLSQLLEPIFGSKKDDR